MFAGMSSEDGDVYIMSPSGDEEWVSPTPAQTAITDALTDATDVSADDIADLETYVDRGDLRAVLDGDSDELTFEVEGHDVTVTAAGDIDVA
jgi:hypothetical protein